MFDEIRVEGLRSIASDIIVCTLSLLIIAFCQIVTCAGCNIAP